MTDSSNRVPGESSGSVDESGGRSDEEWVARSDEDVDASEGSPVGPAPSDEPIRPGPVDPENALFVVLGVIATVALFAHLAAVLT